MYLLKVLCFIVSTVSVKGQASRGKGRKLNFPNMDPVIQSLIPPSSITDEFEDYYYYLEDPLPSGPTRPPPQEPDYYYLYEDEEPLPSGPTREPPLPSGPTRKPGQATSIPPGGKATSLHPALSQLLTLPLLTTPRPRTRQKFKGRNNKKSIFDQTKIFAAKAHFQDRFIAPPLVNAGALPLAIHTIPSGNQFPPFITE